MIGQKRLKTPSGRDVVRAENKSTQNTLHATLFFVASHSHETVISQLCNDRLSIMKCTSHNRETLIILRRLQHNKLRITNIIRSERAFRSIHISDIRFLFVPLQLIY